MEREPRDVSSQRHQEDERKSGLNKLCDDEGETILKVRKQRLLPATHVLAFDRFKRKLDKRTVAGDGRFRQLLKRPF